MKKLLILFSLYLLATAAQAQTAGEALGLKEAEFNFGSIPQGKPVYHTFQVVNNGKQPLTISNVQADCGCTTPEWSREPIAPGTTGSIKVGYNAAVEGQFQKMVTVVYNGNNTKQILIKGEVWRAPAGSAPANASVNFLKQQMQ